MRSFITTLTIIFAVLFCGACAPAAPSDQMLIGASVSDAATDSNANDAADATTPLLTLETHPFSANEGSRRGIDINASVDRRDVDRSDHGPYVDFDHDGVPALYDCDDHQARVAPGLVDYCDELDNDCDGIVDNGFGTGVPCEMDDGCHSPGLMRCNYDGWSTSCQNEKAVCPN